MSDYDRTTRECLASQLRPELLQAIRKYFQEHRLGDVETETIICCETISRRKSASRLASLLKDDLDTTIHTGVLLTPEWLIWVRRGDQSGTLLTAANLKETRVKAYFSILTKDNGLEISGYTEGSKGRVRGYIGMGPEPATQKFCDQVREAITKVNPPVKRSLRKWLGG